MKNLFIRLVALLGAAMAVHGVSAQEPQKHEAELRFDQAQREELADEPFPAVAVDSAVAGRPFAYKLNRKRTTEAVAYDAVTLWNVRKVKIRDRRMKLTDSTRREKVRLLKFFTERDRKKGARPHLLGNVAGYTWSNRIYDETARTRRTVPKHIATYTLRDEYDSVRRAGGDVSMFQVPEELWRRLSPKAVYVLDGVRVPGSVFQFIDGLFLRTLEVHTDRGTMARYDTDQGVVLGDVYPDRIPLVVFGGQPSTIESWLKICHTDAFSVDAAVPMRYFYMLPVEAVQIYGLAGKYGAICVELAE